MAIEYRGEKFSGYNKPKMTPSHPKKKAAVLAKEVTASSLSVLDRRDTDTTTAVRLDHHSSLATHLILRRVV